MKDTQTYGHLIEALSHLTKANLTLQAAIDPVKTIEAKDAGVWTDTHMYVIDLYRQQVELLRDQIQLYVKARIREELEGGE